MFNYDPSSRAQRVHSPKSALFPRKRFSAQILTGLALLLFGLTPCASAQEATPAEASKPRMVVDEGSDTISFAMDREGMEILDFIKWTQQVTGKRFTFNPQELIAGSSSGSKVHFLGTFRIKRDRFQQDFYSFFQTMLYIKGFAVIPRGEGNLELLEIVLMRGARGREVTNGARYVAPEELAAYRHQTGVPILTTVPLHYINAQLANNALRPFFASTGNPQVGGSVSIGNVGNESSLLLQGFGPQVYAAVQLLKLADTPSNTSTDTAAKPKAAKTKRKAAKAAPAKRDTRIQVVVLEHQDPETMQSIVTAVLGDRPVTKTAKPAIKADEVDDETADTITFSMKNKDGMELTEFIQWAQEVTGKRFTFNEQELVHGSGGGNTVNFIGTFRVRRDRFQQDFYSFFQTMLYIKGFAVIPRGEGNLELLEIVMMNGARGREVSSGARYVSPEELNDYRHQTGVPILTTVQLHHINAQLANNALRPFFASTAASQGAGSVSIGNVGNQSSLLLQGFGPQVHAAAQLLKLVDTPAEKPSPGLRVVAHSANKALVISGSPEQIRETLDLIARLDVPSVKIKKSAEIDRLDSVLSADLEKTLQQFLVEEESAETATSSGTGTVR